MHKLTNEHIKRIDSFLERLGCQYIDIRFEMVDHIASEMEDKVEDIPAFFKKNKFETPFLRYMLSKNESFQDTYVKLTKKAWFRNTKSILKLSLIQLTKIKTLLPIAITTYIYFYIFKQLDIKTAIYSSFTSISLAFIITTMLTYRFHKKYEHIYKIRMFYSFYTLIAVTCFQLTNLIHIKNNTYPDLIFHYIGIVFIIIITNAFLEDQKNFSEKYKHLIA